MYIKFALLKLEKTWFRPVNYDDEKSNLKKELDILSLVTK